VKIVAIAAGGHHSLALSDSGAVYAWGWNDHGEIGSRAGQCAGGSTACNSTPVLVRGLGTAGVRTTAIAAGFYHSLALLSDGSVWAWGRVGGTSNTGAPGWFAPGQVVGPGATTAIAAGLGHSLYLQGGKIWGFGDDNHGELGDGHSVPSLSPVQTRGFPSWLSVTGLWSGLGARSFAATNDDELWAWGNDIEGELGHGIANAGSYTSGLPRLDFWSSPTVSLAAGVAQNLSAQADGSVWAWGGNWTGQLGDGTLLARTLPIPVHGLPAIVQVAAGGGHALARARDQRVWSWGSNGNAEVGNGGMVGFVNTPVQLGGLPPVTFVAAGPSHSLVVASDSTVWGWGLNDNGQVGVGLRADLWDQCMCVPTPVQIPGLSGITATAAGLQHSFALRNDGTVWAWGNNYLGQLGIGPPFNGSIPPTQIPGLTGIVAIASSPRAGYAVGSDGSVWAWGSNDVGQLGIGTISDRVALPVRVPIPAGVRIVGISAGGNHVLARDSSGSLWAWDGNWSGQLGDGTAQNRLLPERAPFISGVRVFAAGQNHSVAAN
jgi:alpha-tubulin suppressor-like RCC1 family protein